MKTNDSFPLFTGKQEQMYLLLRTWRDKVLGPLLERLAAHKVQPATLTLLGIFMLLPFVYFFSFHPALAFLFLLANIFFDSLDGSLARFTHTTSMRGALLDISADFFSFAVVFLTFLFFGMLSPFWSALYLLSYAVMEGLVLYARGRGLTVFPVLVSKLIFYGLFLLWLVFGVLWFDIFLVLMSVYMVVTNFFLFLRIYWSLSSH